MTTPIRVLILTLLEGFGSTKFLNQRVKKGEKMPQITRLMQLIEEDCRQKNFSENKTQKILALVQMTLKQGVPNKDDLEDLLETIGRLE